MLSALSVGSPPSEGRAAGHNYNKLDVKLQTESESYRTTAAQALRGQQIWSERAQDGGEVWIRRLIGSAVIGQPNRVPSSTRKTQRG